MVKLNAAENAAIKSNQKSSTRTDALLVLEDKENELLARLQKKLKDIKDDAS